MTKILIVSKTDNDHDVEIELNQGTPNKFTVKPGDQQEIDLHAGQFITKLSEGGEVSRTEGADNDQGGHVELTDLQKDQVAQLQGRYPDHTIHTDFVDSSIYSIVNSGGTEVARGLFEDLIKPALVPDPAGDANAPKEDLGGGAPTDQPGASGPTGGTVGDPDGPKDSEPGQPDVNGAPGASEGNPAPKEAFTIKTKDGELLDGYSPEGEAAIKAALEAGVSGGETGQIQIGDGPWLSLGSAEADKVLWDLKNKA